MYTRKGDDGTTGLLYGGRVPKDSARPETYGQVDELQAFLGVARAHAEPGGELDRVLVGIERDLWVLMADLATDEANRHKLSPGATLTTEEMVTALERLIDDVSGRFEAPREFVVPGETVVAAHLDVARTVCRRARLFERDDDDVYNTYVCVDGDQLLAKFRKLHAFVNPLLSSGSEFVTYHADP